MGRWGAVYYHDHRNSMNQCSVSKLLDQGAFPPRRNCFVEELVERELSDCGQQQPRQLVILVCTTPASCSQTAQHQLVNHLHADKTHANASQTYQE